MKSSQPLAASSRACKGRNCKLFRREKGRIARLPWVLPFNHLGTHYVHPKSNSIPEHFQIHLFTDLSLQAMTFDRRRQQHHVFNHLIRTSVDIRRRPC